MKIDRNKLKKSTTEVPSDCRVLIEKLRNATEDDLYKELQAITTVTSWTYGKCELYHWSDILDKFDEILEKACKKEADKWTLACDLPSNERLKELLLYILDFTSLLIEHSFSRHLYNSMEHLTTLLSSCDMTVVLGVLNLLYVFSKRSNFITRLSNDKKQGLLVRLTHLAESWGGKDNGFGLAECCKELPISSFPSSATTLHFEFYVENKDEKGSKKNAANTITSIHMENLDKSTKLPSQIMEDLLANFRIPEEKQMLLYTHIRLAHLFSNYHARVQCVQARLQALAILVYSNAIQENMNSLLYPGLIEELVDIVELKDNTFVEIKAASLRTLTSIIHLERNPKLNNIIDATGASSYHGFLPVLVRSCIQHMTDPQLTPFPQKYATALFSFLYHLASYENGVEALVSCGMMECLLKVINWYGDGQEHITQFVTRAVRVVDLITNLDMAAFQAQGGLSTFINRLEHEVDLCRKEQPFEIRVRRESILEESPVSPISDMETESAEIAQARLSGPADPDQPSTSTGVTNDKLIPQNPTKTGVQCYPQRAALLKSMLNFLKKAIPDPSFSDSIRHLMDGSLPKSLRHIISNAEYYGPSLFLLATDVVTVYVFQEPSLLSSLQDSGLTDVVLHALLIKDVPATREVLASLPNVFSALCLNARGLQSFVSCKPFDRLFKVLLSPDYLPAMRRRRGSDPFGDTASNLGNAMDELMRHQPSLRTDATKAIIKLLEEVCSMGRDQKYVCVKPTPKTEPQNMSVQSPQPPDNNSSDEEDEEDEIPNTQDIDGNKPEAQREAARATAAQSTQEKQQIPLMDYVLNVMKFVEAILTNNSTDDHCREFVSQKGLEPLMSILGLPNLPIDFPTSPACQTVSIVCKSILNLSREPQVLKQGLMKLDEVLQKLSPLHQPLDPPGGSVLLRELASVTSPSDATLSPQATPLLHALSSCHAYIMMFVHVCRMGQTDLRTISVSHWGSELGLKVLSGLSKLYTSLVWESTVLLALCSEDILPPGCSFGKADMDKLLPKDFKVEKEEFSPGSTKEMGSNGVSAAMESLSTSENNETPMEVNEGASTSKEDGDGKKSKMSPALQAQVKQLKPLLSVSSRLCRTLAELFSLLVKLCVGSPVRQRRSQQIPLPPTVPSPYAQAVAKSLTKLLTNGFQWEPPPYSPVPKLRLTFLVCFVGFMSMLFDEKKQPFHLMLQKFVALGGQDALFKAFEWALSLGNDSAKDDQEPSELSEEIAEFLDSWLMLIERMSNPKTVLETPHVMPAKSSQSGYVPFSAVQYLIKAQKVAFKAVMSLWNKKPLRVYGGRMSESMLAILCNIIKGENVIKERLAKEREELGNASNSSAGAVPSTSGGVASSSGASQAVPMAPSRPSEPEVNEAHLQQLTDMGFSREHGIEALTLTSSLEQATEFILTHPFSGTSRQGAATTGAQNPLGMVMEMSEEDQMMQAIALSLGENVVMSTEESNAPSGSGTKTTESSASKPEEEKPEELNEKQEEEEPLDTAVLDNFTEHVLPGCLRLLDILPETVYRVCDLLIVVTSRNGTGWQKMVLSNLVKEIQSMGQQILKEGHELESATDTNKDHLQSKASKFAARLHLFSLLFEEMMIPCAESVESVWLTDILVQVLNSGQEFLTANKDSVTPKWLSPLLLLLDLYEKVSVISKRKAEANKLLCHSHTWKWFDDSSGRWCKYSAVNNKTIDDAYQAGETSIRFQAGRRRYTVNFNSMVQINEETGNRRPIMLAFPSPEELSENGTKEESKDIPAEVAQSAVSKMETESPLKAEEKMKESLIVSGINSDQITQIIRCIVSLMNIPVEADCLHAALRLILRLTRNHQNAVLFAELGGPRILLTLTQSSSFPGFISLASLIFRHIIEEPASLRYCMEKVVKKATGGTGSSSNGVKPGSMGSKEVNYVFRVLGPAACRDPELFSDVIKTTCRFAIPPASSRRDEDARYSGPQILKSVSTTKCVSLTVESPIKEVIQDLLNCLIAEYNNQEDSVSGGFEVQPPCTLAEAIANEMRPPAIPRQGSSADIVNEEEQTGESESSKDQTKDKEVKVNEDQQKKRPLMPKSSVLRLLSEVVKSYSSCTQLITQYTYHAAQTPLVHEECTVLAFVLDNLLPQCQIFGDRDCPALSRVFIASIASCNHSPDAQMILVTEIKGALQRALVLPESALKHTKIRALTNLISIIIDSCPSPGGQVPNQMFKGQQTVMNNIVKSLLKKGLVTDLARLPHSLDLSSPYMANTINAALKPLETLSRSVNQPAQSVVSKVKKSETETSLQQTTESHEGNTTVPAPTATPAEPSHVGEITIEDISDHTDTGTMEETEPISAVEPENDGERGESELDNVLDVLLNRDGNINPSNEVIGDIVMDSEDLTLHDSQMVSQEISIDDEDGEENVHGDESCIPNEDDSASDVDDDDDDDDDGDDGDGDDGDDEDDEDDEEEDEDDEGSDMEAEDEDDYPDIDPSLNPMSEFDDNLMHMEELFPTGGGRSQGLLFNDNSGLRNIGLQIPISLHDNDNGNDDSAPAIPPAPVNVMSSHPLLVRQPEGHTVMGVQRLHRGRGRREASCRYNPTTQTLHVNLQRQPNPPVILQRLLGPTTAADVLQLTSTLTSVAGPTPGRLMVGNDDLRIISRPDDDFLEEILHDSYGDGGPGGSGVLTYIPSTLTRWTEEAKVLDGDSIHDCVTALKPGLIDYLEKKREEELAERKEKSLKQTEETEANKEKTSNTSIEWESPQNMEVTQTPATSSTSVVSTALTTVTMTAPSDSTVTSTAGRQISASEAAAAAELIATAVVEDILSNPSGQSAPPPPSAPRTDSLPLVRPPADTFTTPAITMPSVIPNAPVVDPRSMSSFTGGTSTPSGPCNLASLLLTEDSSPDSPLSSSSIDAIPHGIGQGSVAPTIQDGSITPEEVSGISSSDAVTVQSSESSEELNPGSILEAPTTNSSSVTQSSAVLDNIASALTIDTAGIATPPAYHGFSSSLFQDNAQSNDPPVNLSALTSSMMGALTASINVPSSILSTGGEAGGSTAVNEEDSTATPSASTTQSGSAPDVGFGDFPDGVDPSFLEALPENIRQEVIAEQMRLQRIRQSAREQAQTAQSTGSLQVNPDFLAALPPNIQEEVLAQQRTEQARLAAVQQQSATSETPVDPVSFLASLPSSLRQQVLADMDDSTVAVLPPDLAAEAQTLRRELEERHRRLMQERLFAQAAGAGSLSAILRHSGFGGRLGGSRFSIRALPRSSSNWTWASNRLNGPSSSSNQNAIKVRGRHLLDHEALTCLLVLLFVDEPKLNTTRLHRVLRNLCYHSPTRVWVIRALLSILQKTGECRIEEEKSVREKGKKKMATDSDMTVKSDTKNQGSWLSISLEAALGCRANVFQIHKTGKKHLSGSCPGTVTIHDQASPVVCRHVLDTLIALAKIFPSQFLPSSKVKEVEKCSDPGEDSKTESESKTKTPCSSASPKSAKDSPTETDFWDHLIKLDSLNANKKGKSVQKTASNTDGETNFFNYDTAPLGQLMFMLSHPVIKRSQLLTDRLLRLLGLVSLALPDVKLSSSIGATPTTAASIPSAGLVTTTASPATSTTTNTTTASTTQSTPTVVSRGVSTASMPAEEQKEQSKVKEKAEEREEGSVVLEDRLQLAVQVLTSKSCSEEGLEDATNLLLQLSYANSATRQAVLKLLLEGARVLGMTVCSHIRSLLDELHEFTTKNKDPEEDRDMEMTPAQSSKGHIQDRYNPSASVVVAAPKKIKVGRELQLPSMSLLTSKTSSQQFFLRILKVIIQLRDAAKTQAKRTARRGERDLSSITEAMAALEAEAEAIMEMVGRRSEQQNQARQQQEATGRSGSTEQGNEGPQEGQQGGADNPPPPVDGNPDSPMDVDQPGPSTTPQEKTEEVAPPQQSLSEQLGLDDLWNTLGECLTELAKTPDHHAVLILQPAVEAFFIVHAGEKDGKSQEQRSQRREDQLAHLNMDLAPASPAAPGSETPAPVQRDGSITSVSSLTTLPPDTQKFLRFAETHRTVLNQILRQSTTPLSDGPFSVLVDHTRILDFDVKRRYFRQELERMDEGMRKEDLAVHVKREHVFEDSFRELFRRTADEWKHRFYIVFEGEEGQDAGGLLREWYIIISREIFNPMYALFRTSPGDRVTYAINPSSHCNSNHLSYYKFVGRIIAKAVYDNKLLDCYFTRSFYKHIIGQPVKYTDMESEDYSFYQGLVFLMENDVADLGYDLTFSTEIMEFGVTESRDLKPGGRNISVNEENKKEYVKLVCQMKMTGAIRQQLNAFMEGFYDIIPKRLISIFNEQELELLISGLPTIDIDDLKANTEYHKYQATSLQVQWFWRALRSFDQKDRAQFLQFVTGTSKVPLQGFAYLEGMNGFQKFQIHRDDRSTDRLPVAHTCFNQLDLPAYETYDKLKRMLLLAINECSEGFGLA
ncbi:E3 ubiquitin-protein ligase HUWE1-like [Saccostrea echinata]|uniref:E3 ubiquitin-protein ligase HUWE1-like n=1 Tax=Saccostrea echinata TaxID=191078 RepID=UPI002A8039A2|nr:E3 ubiquitin-protein ligase HUWE1-like [Saccostrea echinata]